jgi:hypothetical protein
MESLGREVRSEGRVYLTGGACAVLLGWRASTLDVDVKLIPDSDDLLRPLPRLKEALQINVELAAPDQFIPPLPGWPERSPFIERFDRVSFFHYDFYAQALAKAERAHAQDVEDVRAMIAHRLVDPARALELLAAIEPELYRYPALDPAAFRRSAEALFTRA